MSTELNVDVNQFPSLTWNFLKINRTHLNTVLEKDSGFTAIAGNDEIDLKEVDFSAVSSEVREIETGLGKSFDKAFDDFSQNGKTVVVNLPESKGCASYHKVKILLEQLDCETKAKDFVIHGEKNSCGMVLFTFKNGQLNNGTLGVRIRVVAEENADIKICLVNLLGNKVIHFVSLGSLVKDNACVDVTELQLGGEKVYSGNFQQLSGYKSKCTGHTAYLARFNSSFDFNYVANHTGRETESFMACDGVADDNAEKVWRGTINFVKGCAESKGDEQENVLLLSPKVVNKTLPVILCDEEAVEGRHGASIGKVGSDMLFYLQSRGVTEKEAQRLMVMAKINSVCRYITDDETVQDVNSYLNEIFGEKD
ncbi:MAG: SufD family Fe-S cluster assembly protein [Treponema sp.]|nr:SufD family Fe-S cluster assembly protein [Spirochaetia bacterium]MDD7013734.1 SufD family Fe-S cluster assembly protein [Spirochaetales bacterium]MDY4902678.1 SufD family Fe-S cluster assembly protein [Treponema sp.]